MLETFSYCPLLYTRVAEVKALTQLPATSKDKIFPLLIARPWPNAKALSKTWEKIASAVEGRPFALDLDRTKLNRNSERSAVQDFAALFDEANGHEAYYGVVEDLSRAVPVLRIDATGIPDLAAQVEHIERIDRGVVLHIQHDAGFPDFDIITRTLEATPDVAIFVDAGWSRDLLGRELWASQIIGHVTAIRPDVAMVVSGSSFPDTFTNISKRGEIFLSERALFSNLSRRHNAARVIYGDWGSTKPPVPPAPMKIVYRLDLPLAEEWVVFRQVEDEDYPDIARRVVDDDAWPTNLNIWGTYEILATAEDLPTGIKSPAGASAARINIHLHRQAHFGEIGEINDVDEPYTDD